MRPVTSSATLPRPRRCRFARGKQMVNMADDLRRRKQLGSTRKAASHVFAVLESESEGRGHRAFVASVPPGGRVLRQDLPPASRRTKTGTVQGKENDALGRVACQGPQLRRPEIPGIAWDQATPVRAQTRELRRHAHGSVAVTFRGLDGTSLGELRRSQSSRPRVPPRAHAGMRNRLSSARRRHLPADSEPPSLSSEDLDHAQTHLRIISGLYGLLRPLDLIQPYRLEMGTRLTTPRGHSLYDFWGDRIARALNRDLKQQDSPVVVNAASKEYFHAIPSDRLKAPVITPVFKEMRNGVGSLPWELHRQVVRARMSGAFMSSANGSTARGPQSFDADGYRC